MKHLFLTALLVLSAGAVADDNVRFVETDATWREECGACHIAYPPRLLDANAWRTIMQNLGDHFGSDASVDADVAANIEDFLADNAARKRRTAADGLPRITVLPWFRNEHREEVPARIWQSKQVREGVNCEACHRKAAEGDFGEKSLRLPAKGEGDTK